MFLQRLLPSDKKEEEAEKEQDQKEEGQDWQLLKGVLRSFNFFSLDFKRREEKIEEERERNKRGRNMFGE